MRKLSREEKRIVIRLFNHLFSIDSKMKFLKVLFPFTTTELNQCRGNETKVNEIFDQFFSIEDKINGIKINYEVAGYNFETIEDIC